MDILIRHMDEIIVQKIDQEAKQKGLSRNDYLKLLIAKWAIEQMGTEQRNLYHNALEMNARLLHEVTSTQQHLLYKVERMNNVFEKILSLQIPT